MLSTGRQAGAVPKTRRGVDRDAKVDEVLDATEARLKKGGYPAVSVAGIARELGVAPNAIYWYFPSKDDLVVSTLQRMIDKIVQKKPTHFHSVVDRVLWFVDQLAVFYPIRASLHEHRDGSPAVKEFLDDLEDLLRTMLRNLLSTYVDENDLDVATATFVATVQGSFLRGISCRERRRILTFTLERLIAGAAT